MGRYFTLTLAHSSRRGYRRATINPHLIGGPVAVGFAVVGMVFVIGLLYLTQINTVSTKGYQIKQLQDQITDLQGQNQKLELKATELQSIQELHTTSSTTQINMVPIASVQFLPGRQALAER